MADHGAGREFDLIAKYFRPLAADDAGALGLSDDAALVDVPDGRQLVVTTDALVAGVHFLDTLSPQDIAHKVVGVNLSDLAAMGARPQAVFLAAQLTSEVTDDWIAAFAAGLQDALEPSGARLLGGDTVSTPGPQAFTLTALGTVQTGQALKRSGAQAGDLVFVTGTIGDGALGLKVLQGALDGLGPDHAAHLARRYARPEPRWAFAAALAGRGLAHAAVDVSDGLIADVAHVCEASNVRAVIEAQQVPLSPAAHAALALDAGLMGDILTGGDDYELAFTAPERALAAIEALGEEMNQPVTVIGRVETPGAAGQAASHRVAVMDAHGQKIPLKTLGFRHL